LYRAGEAMTWVDMSMNCSAPVAHYVRDLKDPGLVHSPSFTERDVVDQVLNVVGAQVAGEPVVELEDTRKTGGTRQDDHERACRGFFDGNTADPSTLSAQIAKAKGRFGIRRLVLVGDRGMITSARIRDELRPAGLDWITCLRASAV